jgi:uncharacterized protein YgiB involved in biofilm formation
MKYIVFSIILGVAGLMAFWWFRGECPGGRVVTSIETCRTAQGFEPAFCAEVFRRAVTVARTSSTVYTDQMACRNDYGDCLPHATNRAGFVPRPAGFCVSADSDGRIATMEPVYRRLR